MRKFLRGQSTNLIRLGVVAFFAWLAYQALYLDFRFGDSIWQLQQTPEQRFYYFVLTRIGPELAGIVIGLVVIDALNERRSRDQLREQLIRQMSSPHPDVSHTATEELRANLWHIDDHLEGHDFRDANLPKVNLIDANLKRANFARANLQEASLDDACLQEAIFFDADLSNASLSFARLNGANLTQANLEGANLTHANLEGALLSLAQLTKANLESANLTGADLRAANLERAKLRNANLTNADLEGANLSRANLESAIVTIQQLRTARSVEWLFLPDGQQIGYVIPPNDDEEE